MPPRVLVNERWDVTKIVSSCPDSCKQVKHSMFAHHQNRDPSISDSTRGGSSQASTRNMHFSPAMISKLPSAGFHSAPPADSATISSKSPIIYVWLCICPTPISYSSPGFRSCIPMGHSIRYLSIPLSFTLS